MKVAITGHRPNKLGNDYDLTSPLIDQIDMLISGITDIKSYHIILASFTWRKSALGVWFWNKIYTHLTKSK